MIKNIKFVQIKEIFLIQLSMSKLKKIKKNFEIE